MRSIVYAIGGTGAKLLESLVYLCAAGIARTDLDIRQVDQDLNNGNSVRTFKLLEAYRSARDAAGPDPGSPLFHAELRPAPAIMRAIADQNDTLASAFDLADTPPPVDSACTASEMLMQVLFSAEIRAKDMSIGFEGRPAVGSAVFLSRNGREEALWAQIEADLKRVRNDEIDQILLLGSAVGGTGASGVPTIGSYLHASLPGTRIGAVLMLPYFQAVGTGEAGPAAPAQMKAALEFYYRAMESDTRAARARLVESAYVVGLEAEIGIERKPPGGPRQANAPLFPELVGAYGATHFLQRGGMTKTVDPRSGQARWSDDRADMRVWICGHEEDRRIGWDDLPDPAILPDGESGSEARRLLCSFARFAFFYCYGLHPAEKLSELHNPDKSPVYFRPLDIAALRRGSYDDAARAVFAFAEDFLAWFGALHATTQRPARGTSPPHFAMSLMDKLVAEDTELLGLAASLSPDPARLGGADHAELQRLDEVFASLDLGRRAPGSAKILNAMARAPVPSGPEIRRFVGMAYAAAVLPPN